MAMERTNAGDNRFVNNKDFGKIAQSSRGSNTPTQIGNENQRENYRANPKDPKVSAQTSSTEKKMAAKVGPNGSYKNSKGEQVFPGANESTARRTYQRKGGSGR